MENSNSHKCDKEVVNGLELRQHKCTKKTKGSRKRLTTGEYLNAFFMQLYYDDIEIGPPFNINRKDYNVCNSMHTMIMKNLKTPEKSRTRTPTSRTNRYQNRNIDSLIQDDITNRNIYLDSLNDIEIETDLESTLYPDENELSSARNSFVPKMNRLGHTLKFQKGVLKIATDNKYKPFRKLIHRSKIKKAEEIAQDVMAKCILTKYADGIRHNKELLIDVLQLLDLVVSRIEAEICLSKDSVVDVVSPVTNDVVENSDALLKKFFLSEDALMSFSKKIQSELPEKGYNRYKSILEEHLIDVDGNSLFNMPSNYKMNLGNVNIIGSVLVPEEFGDGIMCEDTSETMSEQCSAVPRSIVERSKTKKGRPLKKGKEKKKKATESVIESEPEKKEYIKHVAKLDLDATQLYDLMKNKINKKYFIDFKDSEPCGMIQSWDGANH